MAQSYINRVLILRSPFLVYLINKGVRGEDIVISGPHNA
jgi:hypothetical protein